MSLDQIQLSAQKILNKDFKSSMRGYNQEEVDEFLDIIIQDYELFTKEIEKMQKEIKRLQQKEEASHSERSHGSQQANYDVLKRLSNLEKVVFGNKLTDDSDV